MNNIKVFEGSISLKYLIKKNMFLFIIGILPALMVFGLGDLTPLINILIGIGLLILFLIFGTITSRFDIKVKDNVVILPASVHVYPHDNAYAPYGGRENQFTYRFTKDNVKRAYPLLDKGAIDNLKNNNNYEIKFLKNDKNVMCIEFNEPLVQKNLINFISPDKAYKLEKIYVSVKKIGEFINELNKK